MPHVCANVKRDSTAPASNLRPGLLSNGLGTYGRLRTTRWVHEPRLVASLARVRPEARLQRSGAGRKQSHWHVGDGRGCQQTRIHMGKPRLRTFRERWTSVCPAAIFLDEVRERCAAVQGAARSVQCVWARPAHHHHVLGHAWVNIGEELQRDDQKMLYLLPRRWMRRRQTAPSGSTGCSPADAGSSRAGSRACLARSGLDRKRLARPSRPLRG